MKALRPIGHDDRLSIIDHLDELRSRIIFCGLILIVAFGICFWQNQGLLSVLNRALPPAASSGVGAQPKEDASLHKAFGELSAGIAEIKVALAHSKGLAPSAIQGVDRMLAGAKLAESIEPKKAPKNRPVVLGPTESFTTTLLVVAYFTLLVTLPVLLYEIYAFVIPALSRDERRIATPTVLAAPLLFVAGAVFTYFEVLPPAIHFLLGYNSQNFQTLPQARPFYKFEILLMIGIGLAFEVPLVLLGLQRLGVITADTLTGNWRYAVVIIAVIVAALPGVDPVTMTLETLPLVFLYLLSIVLLHVAEHRMAKREAAELAAAGEGADVT